MSILVNVVNQKMYVSSNADGLVAGSQRFVQFKFNLSSEWDGLMTFAQFRQGTKTYNDYLDANNCVYLPAEIGVGTCTLMLYGSHNTTIGTTNYLTFKIGPNNLVSDAESTEISQSLYNQLVTKINAISGGSIQSAVTSVNGKTGDVVLRASDVGALPNTTHIPDAYTHPESHPASMITGLSAVATTGSYRDLKDTPVVGGVPDALPNPYALTINGQTYDGSRAVKVEVCGDDIPDYVRSEADRLAAKVQLRQNANTFTLMLGSDIHARLGFASGSYNTEQMLASTKHAAQGMELVRKKIIVDGAGLLGDFLWDEGESAEQALTLLRTVHEYFAPAFSGIPQFWARGNHDMLKGQLTQEQVYAAVGGHNRDSVFPQENKLGGYCHRDFEEMKLRIVVMNTTETVNNYAVGTAQLNWLSGVLEVEDGWKVIILSHIPLDWWGTGAAVYTAVAQHQDKILCNIHGHTHNYITGLVGDTTIPRIAIPNIDFYRQDTYATNETFGEGERFDKEADSATDTAFCVVTIDLAQNKLYADRYGAGYDREVDLSTGETIRGESSKDAGGDNGGDDTGDTGGDTGGDNGGDDTGGDEPNGYTNLLTSAVDENGQAYNGGKGYKEGYRLNSSGKEDTATGNCCTGFIAVKSADTVYIRNITVSGGSTPRIWSYKANFVAQNFNDLTNLTPDANGVYAISMAPFSSNETSYFRFNCCVISDDTIVTVNEEIE